MILGLIVRWNALLDFARASGSPVLAHRDSSSFKMVLPSIPSLFNFCLFCHKIAGTAMSLHSDHHSCRAGKLSSRPHVSKVSCQWLIPRPPAWALSQHVTRNLAASETSAMDVKLCARP